MFLIESDVIKHLRKTLEIPVYAERPQTLPKGEFIIIDKTGGREKNHISEAIIAIQSIGLSKSAAAKLNERVKTVMQSFANSDEISRCSLNSDYNFTDTSTKEYRYQAVYEITYLGGI